MHEFQKVMPALLLTELARASGILPYDIRFLALRPRRIFHRACDNAFIRRDHSGRRRFANRDSQQNDAFT